MRVLSPSFYFFFTFFCNFFLCGTNGDFSFFSFFPLLVMKLASYCTLSVLAELFPNPTPADFYTHGTFAAAAAATCAANENTVGPQELPLPHVVLPPPGAVVEAELFREPYFYSVALAVGAPPGRRTYRLLADTGSADLWLTNDTTLTGAPYDYHGDTSRHDASDGDSVLRYMAGEVAVARATNTLEVGGAALHGAPYGVACRARGMPPLGRAASGYLGLGYGRTNLPRLLRMQGHIKRTAYAVALEGPGDGRPGSILFGGVDHSRYSGALVRLPRRDIPALQKRCPLAVHLRGVSCGSGETEGNETASKHIALDVVAALDTGSTLTYLPPAAYAALCTHFGVTTASFANASGYPLLDVSLSGSKTVTLDFGGGATLTTTGHALSFAFGRDPRFRVFGVASWERSRGVAVVGASVLQAAYVVFDLEGGEIAVAQATRGGRGGDPQIEPMVSGIPRAQALPEDM